MRNESQEKRTHVPSDHHKGEASRVGIGVEALLYLLALALAITSWGSHSYLLNVFLTDIFNFEVSVLVLIRQNHRRDVPCLALAADEQLLHS